MTRARQILLALLASAPLAWTSCGGGAPARPPEPAPAPSAAAKPDAAPRAEPAAVVDEARIDEWNQEAVGHIENKEYPRALALIQKVLKADPKNVVALYNAACACALQGDKAKAVDFLARSVKAGWDDFDHMQNDSDLDSIRNEPGYRALLPK